MKQTLVDNVNVMTHGKDDKHSSSSSVGLEFSEPNSNVTLGVKLEANKTVEAVDPHQERKLIKVVNLISSSTTQLEFFTLFGIIFNALMQGYVCVNSIYIYLIQDIEADLKPSSSEKS